MTDMQETKPVFTIADTPFSLLIPQQIAKAYGWEGDIFNHLSPSYNNASKEPWQAYQNATNEAINYLNSLCSDDLMFVWVKIDGQFSLRLVPKELEEGV